ncbi:hypothetical protein EIP91_000049 [Steccherinum ochraceum]|uniref:Uncharacterized protein n=1 Tax=Steccherinum ochraceum TaxID=92696 RepID=A0A4V2MXY8_9APHY|nr:hypothetical protein EIP91_000049 [Steccherinum ochraceum]
MNTARSSVMGWGALVVAAGASYYWAKQGINERRKEQEVAGTRSTEKLDWRAKIERDAQNAATLSTPPVVTSAVDSSSSSASPLPKPPS